MTIAVDNERMAKFIGMKYGKHGQPNPYWEIYDDCGVESPKPYPQDHDLQFNHNWNWMMAVLRKIDEVSDDSYGNLIGDITHALLDYDIIAVHEAATAFIIEHNKRKSTKR